MTDQLQLFQIEFTGKPKLELPVFIFKRPKKIKPKPLDLFQSANEVVEVKKRKKRKVEFRPEQSEFNKSLDERNRRLMLLRPKFRMNYFKNRVILLTKLKRFWLTIYDVAAECNVTTRTAKKLLAWARAHYHVESRRHEESAEKEHHITNPIQKSIRTFPCFYECCDDIRHRDEFGDVQIYQSEEGTVHMWREIAAEYHERSGFQVGPDTWAPIGIDAPAKMMITEELIEWLCEIPEISMDEFIDDDEAEECGESSDAEISAENGQDFD